MATNQQINKFISSIGPVIQEYAKSRGYKTCSCIIAQACCESNFGISSLGARYHNYFGMKCGSSWKGRSVNLKTKEEYKVGVLTTIRDNFRVYNNMEEGVKGYFDFVGTKRYANLKTADTPQKYAELLKADGYATSSKYVSTLVSYIEKYDLARFDCPLGQISAAQRPNIAIANNPFKEPACIIKYGSRGEGAKWVQWCLWRFGLLEETGIDGTIGTKSEAAIKTAQMRLRLAADGIVGKKTRQAFKRVFGL